MEGKIIKNIITAIGNPILNNELNKIEKIKIINNDILYQDGILEILDSEKEIDFLILSQLLQGNYILEELIEKIKEKNKKIKIIIILENIDDELENILNKKGVYRIIYNNNVEINDIIKIINEDEKMEKYNEEIRKEIEELKEYIINNKKYKKNTKKIIFGKINNNKLNINNKSKNNIENKIIKNNNKINIKNKYIKILKNKILDNIFNKLNKNNLIHKIIKNNSNKLNQNKIISILGNSGSGKSVFSILLANYLKKDFNKILIIDFDVLNNSLHTILGVNKYSEKIKKIIKENNYEINNNKNNQKIINEKDEKINIENLIIKINKKIDLISGINLLFNKNIKNNIEKLNEVLQELLNKYEKIIIDTSSECFFDYTKEIIKISDNNIFLTEANLLEISKSKRILDIYYNNWKIEKNKIKIIFNKFNNKSINLNLLKKLYNDYEILGKINTDNIYNSLINYNFKNIFIYSKKLKKLYKIGEKIKY